MRLMFELGFPLKGVEARIRREMRRPVPRNRGLWKSRYELRLVGESAPIVDDPYKPLNLIANTTTVGEENERRGSMPMQRLAHPVLFTGPVEGIFSAYPDVVEALKASNYMFDAVFIDVPSLDGTGRLTRMPRVSMAVITTRDVTLIFGSNADAEVLQGIGVPRLLPLPVDGYGGSDIFELFDSHGHVIRLLDATTRIMLAAYNRTARETV